MNSYRRLPFGAPCGPIVDTMRRAVPLLSVIAPDVGRAISVAPRASVSMTITKPYCVPSGRRCLSTYQMVGRCLMRTGAEQCGTPSQPIPYPAPLFIPNDNAGPLSPAAEVLAERIKRAATADWQHLRHDVQVKLIEWARQRFD